MTTVQYELKSRPGTSVTVPEAYARNAAALVACVTQNADLSGAFPRYPHLGYIGVLSRVARLLTEKAGTDEYRRLEDEIYLRVFIRENEQRMRGPERQQATELEQELFWALSMCTGKSYEPFRC